MDMETGKYLILPIISALIGWGTNYVAVKMLFHPREPIKVFGYAIQGVFPKRQGALAENLGRMVEQELVSHEDIQRVIHDPAFIERFRDLADPYIDAFIHEKLPGMHPMVGMFLTEENVARIKAMLSDQIMALLPPMMEKVASGLEEGLDFRDMVREKVESFSMDKLESILFSIMRREFKFIELAGGVLGFAVGVFQSAAFYML